MSARILVWWFATLIAADVVAIAIRLHTTVAWLVAAATVVVVPLLVVLLHRGVYTDRAARFWCVAMALVVLGSNLFR